MSAIHPGSTHGPLDDADLASYLDRIGIGTARPGPPDLDLLQAVAAAHPTSIPFDGLDAFTGRRPGLAQEDLTAKLVRGGRGGWCYEHNGLLRRALDALGFRTTGLAARVRWGEAPDAPPTARTHMLLLAELDDGPYLVDAGFGGMVPTGVLRLEDRTEQKTPLEPYRVLAGRDDGPGDHRGAAVPWTVQALVGGAWRDLYEFETTATPQIDYEVGNHYLATHPESPFRMNLIAARPGTDRRTNLINRTLTVHHLGGPSEQTDLGSPSAVRDALEDGLGIDTSGVDGLGTRLADLFRTG